MKQIWLHRAMMSFASCICSPLIFAYLRVNGPEWVRPVGSLESPLGLFCVLLGFGSGIAGVMCLAESSVSRDEE